MTEGQASISTDIIARYAADAALEVDGVESLAGRRGVKVEGQRLELHLVVAWGSSIPEIGAEVQARVRSYVEGMTDIELDGIDIIVDSIA